MISSFITLINMSISAALVIVVLLAVRHLFGRRLPAFFSYLLWGAVLFRLAVPFSFSAFFSALALTGNHSQPAGPGGIVATVVYLEPEAAYSTAEGDFLWGALALLWAVGVAFMLIYAAAGHLSFRRKAATAFVIRDNPVLAECAQQTGLRRTPGLYHSGAFLSPVILGLLRPRILLPSSFALENKIAMRQVLTHECVHLKRWDHIFKALFYLALCVHWFNPLVWLACVLLDRDVESSCDERTLSLLGAKQAIGYARLMVELSAEQKSLLQGRLAFSESNLRRRVEKAIHYKPLTGIKRASVIAAVVLIGLTVAANPLQGESQFVPQSAAVSAQARERFEAGVGQLSTALDTGNLDALLELTNYTDPYYRTLYQDGGITLAPVKKKRLYPQSEEIAYCYLTLEDGGRLVATLEGATLTALQSEAYFEAAKGLDPEDEAVRFVGNLHRFGILEQIDEPASIPRPAIAGLCIDEVYQDKLKAGKIVPEDIYLTSEDVATAAWEYFGREEFSYTFDPDLYDHEREMYVYDPNRGGRYDAQVTAVAHDGNTATVTAIVYRDPLHLLPESEITYTLQLRRS